jgi:hypothetical protein
VDVARPTVELEHPGRHPVEDVAVVGHHDEPAPEAGQVLLEPRDGVEVEVVGRLVEDEEVALVPAHRQQGPRQRHPLRLAARQGGDVGIHQRSHAEPVEHRLDLPGRARGVGGRRPDGAGGQVGVLVEGGDAHAPATAHDPRLRLRHPGDDAQQRRLAAPVEPDDAEPVAGGHGE